MESPRIPVAIELCRIPGPPDLPLPSQATAGASGMDLYAHITRQVLLRPGERCLIGTGIAIALPGGYEAQVRPRSGWAIRDGVTVVNAPGTIDSDYRGEIRIGLVNLGDRPVWIQPGDRVAQLVVQHSVQVSWKPVARLTSTSRGSGGFGHTGR